MTKLVVGFLVLAFGYFLGDGWKNAGVKAYDVMQQTEVEK